MHKCCLQWSVRNETSDVNVASDIGSLPSNKKPKGGASVNSWEHVSLLC